MKQLKFVISVVLVLIALLALPAQAQPSIQLINETINPGESEQSPATIEGHILQPSTPLQGPTMQPNIGKAIVDITGIQINNSGNATFFLTTPDWVSVRNQPSVLYLPLQSDANLLTRQKMFDLLFYAYSNKQDISIDYDRMSKEIQVVYVAL